MGFKLERRTAKITFPDNHEYAGLEMECKLDVDLQTFLEIQSMAESATPDGNAGVYTKFGEDILVNWNLEDEDGTPVNIRMSLTFKELNPIYHEDYQTDGAGPGVGY